MIWVFEFTIRDFCYLVSLYKIQWKAKGKLEFLGQSEGIFLERALVVSEGYSISSKGFLPTVVDIIVI